MQVALGATVTAEDIAGLPWVVNNPDGMQLFPFNEEIKKRLEVISDFDSPDH